MILQIIRSDLKTVNYMGKKKVKAIVLDRLKYLTLVEEILTEIVSAKNPYQTLNQFLLKYREQNMISVCGVPIIKSNEVNCFKYEYEG